ncbi:MAG: TrbI/VirB10 family protein [Pseudomonadota bacterium]
MKSKLTKRPDPEIDEQEDDEEGVEVGASGPAIAAAKKSKMAIIAASSILITVVVYFMFFKEDAPKKENLEEVAPPAARVAPSEEGKSPFEIETPEKKEDISLLDKPAKPDVPTLPELPEGMAPQPEQVIPNANPQQNPQAPQQLLPTQNMPGQQNNNPAQANSQTPENSNADNNQPAEKTKDTDPRYAPIIVFGGTAEGTPSRGVGYENNIVNLDQDPINKLQKSKTGVTATFIDDRAHTIAQGKLLTAVLETAINTEIPGFVRAIISRDVYAEAGNKILVPRGSRLFGTYSSKITRGQGRVEIAWTRLIRPDGVDMSVTFSASDQFGRAGIPGDVDNKYSSLIANSMLTSILAVGGVVAAQKLLGSSSAQNTTTTNPTQGTTTTTGSAANQAIYDVSKTIIDTVGQVIGSTLDSTPVIRVPQGTRITVVVNADINIPSMK